MNYTKNKPKTLNLTFDKEIKKDKLTEFINSISKDSFRIKGFFKLADGWNQVDGVNQKMDYKLIDEKNEVKIIKSRDTIYCAEAVNKRPISSLLMKSPVLTCSSSKLRCSISACLELERLLKPIILLTLLTI